MILTNYLIVINHLKPKPVDLFDVKKWFFLYSQFSGISPCQGCCVIDGCFAGAPFAGDLNEVLIRIYAFRNQYRQPSIDYVITDPCKTKRNATLY